MGCQINWTSRAWISFEANIEYLQKEWTVKEVSNFVASIDKSRNKKYPHIRFVVIHKRLALIYKYKPLKNEIDLLIFWNTYRNPGKLKVK